MGGTRNKIAVVGPGRMGIGIVTAILMAARGHVVHLIDVKARDLGGEYSSLGRAREEVKGNLQLLRDLGALDEDPDELLCELHLHYGLPDELAQADFIFEALPEKVVVKRSFLRGLADVLGPASIVASASSTFDLSVLADLCPDQGRVLMAHWLNPAFLIPLVEVAHGEQTDEAAVEALEEFLAALGKITVRVRSSPGFIVPRIQVAAMNEAVRLVEEGVATAEQVDTAMKSGFGFRLAVLGLIEFIDLGGIDVLAYAGNYLFECLGQEHYRPPALLQEKMAAGEVGPRAGKGFYDYHGVDTAALFRQRYRGFVELLNFYRQSGSLDFRGGIDRA